MILTGLRAFFGRNVKIITIVLVVSLGIGVAVVGNLYKNQLERNSQLELSLQLQTDALMKANKKLRKERESTTSLRQSLELVSKKYSRLSELVEGGEYDENGNLTDDAVLGILCKGELADPRLCD